VGYKHDSSGRILLESKQDMKKRGVPSPDLGDAVALCFAGTAGSSVVSISGGSRYRTPSFPPRGSNWFANLPCPVTVAKPGKASRKVLRESHAGHGAFNDPIYYCGSLI